MKLSYKKVSPRAQKPVIATANAAGIDLVAVTKTKTQDYTEYGTGLAFEIPVGFVGLLFPRSSVSKKALILANSVGVIDSDYRGEVKCRFKRTDNSYNDYDLGERVAQLVIVPTPQCELEEVEGLSDTARGDAGFGSTGLC